MGGLFLLGGLAGAVLLLLPVVLIVGMLAILILRRDDDADGNRAPALYGAVVAFVGLLTLLVAVTGVVSSLLELTADDDRPRRTATFAEEDFGDDFFEPAGDRDPDDEAVSGAIVFAIVGLVAAGLLVAHRPLFGRWRSFTGAGRRVHRAYLLLLCLFTALIAMSAAGLTLYSVYRAIAPGVAGADNRADELRALGSGLTLLLGSAFLWQRHWRQLDLGGPAEVTPAAAP